MRSNGVPNYPEPKLINRAIRISFTPSLNPAMPAVQTAAVPAAMAPTGTGTLTCSRFR